ncbi:hypothetical protein Pint_23232 [Pistacia integerrima]|uniref:Uncharacterized protein n=1 Tax=Pistacia integerrima TaxID=434235 RepID=A0ACC0YLU1_9ROSI|nr:hypothetical protein Pint_23232 [Pistacia integerrima]
MDINLGNSKCTTTHDIFYETTGKPRIINMGNSKYVVDTLLENINREIGIYKKSRKDGKVNQYLGSCRLQ